MAEKQFRSKADILTWLGVHWVDNPISDKGSHLIYGIFAEILKFYDNNADKITFSTMDEFQKDVRKLIGKYKNILDIEEDD